MPTSEPPGPSLSVAPVARLALCSVFTLLAVLAFRQVGSLDTGFHLKAGEHILSGKGWPTNDPFTFTLRDHPYVDTTWGYQVVLAVLHRAAGTHGIVLLDVLLVVGVFLVVARTARLASVDPLILAALLLLGGLGSELRFETRPELASWLYFAIVIHLLHRRALGRSAPLWILPLLHGLWANTHALFVLGWGALACFLVAETIRSRRLPGDLLAWSAASVAVAVLNPYGVKGLMAPFTLATRLMEGNVFAQSIGEFVSPFALRLSAQFPFYPRVPVFSFRLFFALAALAGTLSLLVRRDRASGRGPHAALLFVAFAPLAFRMIRNAPLLVIATLPTTAWVLSARLGSASQAARGDGRRPLRAVLAAVTIVVALGTAVRAATGAYYVSSRRPERFGWSWNAISAPVDAARFADRVGLRGPMLNHLNFGGYWMWARPDPVFIDGRLEVVGEEFFRSYQAILGGEAALEAAVSRYHLGWIVFPYATNPQLLKRLGQDPRWRLAYFDALAAIFVREGPGASRFVDPGLASSLAGASERVAIDRLPGLGGTPRPGRLARFVSGFAAKRSFPSDAFYRGLFHYVRGELPQAEGRFAEALRESGGAYYEIYNNLGSALWQQRRAAEAAACYRIVLEEDPANRIARERTGGFSPPTR